jgi:hypothetical protein
MIDEPTCLILGAGASAPYGLPTTNELRHLMLPYRSDAGAAVAGEFPLTMAEKPWSDAETPAKQWLIYLNEVTDSAGLKHLLQDFFSKFSGTDRSIDWFLRRNDATFGDVARLQIAAVLLACERWNKLHDDWYRLLSEEIIPRNLEAIEEGRLSVISFNYDRSFERYFLSQFENLCGFPIDEARAALRKIRIEHVYGQLGTLDEVPYGDFTKAATAAKGIRTIRLEPDADVQARVGQVIRDATYVNFIGFGFDDDNVALLGPENFKGKRVYSTTYGMSARVRAKVRQTLGVQFSSKEPATLTAAELINVKDLFGPKLRPPSAPKPRLARPRSQWVSGWKL